MIFLLIFLAGAVMGGVFAGMLITSKSRSKYASVEATLSETRRQLEEKNSELEKLRKSLQEEQQTRIAAITRLDEATKSIEEQRKILSEAQQRLTDTFKALSDDALKSNNQAFIQLAKQSLETVLSDAKGDLGKKQEAIGNLVKPLEEALKRYESQIGKMEQDRSKAYGSLEEQLRGLMITQQQLQKETGNLSNALKTPQVRGRWGEVTLKRVIEVAGMSPYCDFIEQVSIETDEGRLRPDVIVQLPENRCVVIDAKVPLSAYSAAMEEEDETQRKILLEQHAQAVKEHVKLLSGKKYWESVANSTPDFVVLFLPAESFFSAAVEQDRTLIEQTISKRVLLATPTTLIALLRTVAYSWQEHQMTENSRKIAEVGMELFDRLCKFVEHMENIRYHLEKTTHGFNDAVGSWESRLVSSARRLKELGAAATEKEVPTLKEIEAQPRRLNSSVIEQSPRQLEAVEPLEQ